MEICRAHVTTKRRKMDAKSSSLGTIWREPVTGMTTGEAYTHKGLVLEEEVVSSPIYHYE